MINNKLLIREIEKVRIHWNKKKQKRYFAVSDIIQKLTGNSDPESYWSERKLSVQTESGVDLSKMCIKVNGVEFADIESLFRIIQSIPSSKVETIKLWLAKVGNERLEDINDPEKSLNRTRDYWKKMGRSGKWIQQRMMGQEIRNKLTDYWKDHNVTKEQEYATLTNIIHHEWSGLNVKSHKELKNLKLQNLRDHMTDAELIFTALAELSTRQIAESDGAIGFFENKTSAVKGGRIAKGARIQLEEKTGKKVVSGQNFLVEKEIKKIN